MVGDWSVNLWKSAKFHAYPVEGAKRVRLASLLAACLTAAMISTSLGAVRTSADSCHPGWSLAAEYDNSFVWGNLFDSVTWTGSVQLLENYDSDCNVLELRLDFTGPVSGGTLSLTGDPFVSFTVQHPDPFNVSGDVAQNAVGDLVWWNPPAGSYLGYEVDPHFDVNAKGADEYFVRGTGIPGVVTNVVAAFALGLDFRGETVYAQVHVGPDLCQCEVTAVDIPGVPPPPPPPEPEPEPEPGPIWDVYVHAHQDDWQLFESPNIFGEYQAGDNVLIVYVSAGDAGSGSFWWGAREEGAMASVRVVAGNGSSESKDWTTICYTEPISASTVCHDIWQWNYGRTVSFFMRLPDGNPSGGGYPSNGQQSLTKLQNGTIPSIAAVDGSARYDSWEDLYRTLNEIITRTTPYSSTTRINSPDYDRDRQTTHVEFCADCPDHADHLAVADLMWEITIGMDSPWARAWFIDYPIAWADERYPVNLDSYGYDLKEALFMAYSDRVKELTGIDEYRSMPWFWENCFWRNYYRAA